MAAPVPPLRHKKVFLFFLAKNRELPHWGLFFQTVAAPLNEATEHQICVDQGVLSVFRIIGGRQAPSCVHAQSRRRKITQTVTLKETSGKVPLMHLGWFW